MTTDANHVLWTSQRAVRQRVSQQKASLQPGFVWGVNVLQFSCCYASNGFSASDHCGNVSTFAAVADLDRKDAMSNHLVLTSRRKQNKGGCDLVLCSRTEMIPVHVGGWYQTRTVCCCWNNMQTLGVELNTCCSTGDGRMCGCSQKLTAVHGASFHHSWAITISHYWARIYIVLNGT